MERSGPYVRGICKVFEERCGGLSKNAGGPGRDSAADRRRIIHAHWLRKTVERSTGPGSPRKTVATAAGDRGQGGGSRHLHIRPLPPVQAGDVAYASPAAG